MAEEALLTMRGICKYFPGVRALENVDFTLHSGEVHALVGENGAGKSTLIKVLTGVHAKDGGKIAMEGRPISPSSPLEAMKCGISTVYQEVNLCPNLSVAENIFIGREPKKAGGIDWKTINRRAAELLTTLNLNIDVTKTLGSYSVAVQQMIAIARAVDVDAKVLILDEPTSSLDEEETQRLFAVVRKLKAQGLGVIFVSHFLDQIYELCDRITVLRNGELVGAYAVAELPRVDRIPCVRFDEAKRLAAEKYGRPIRDPFDLEPEEEANIGRYFQEEYGADFVFVTHYPSKKRPFYAMDDPEDPRCTLSFDLLFRGMEVTTGGQRVHDYQAQVAKMEARGMHPEEFRDFLTIHQHGMPPHGGLGIGLERLTMKLCGLENVREASLFPRDQSRLEP